MDPQGKKIIVTGGAKGLGRHLVERLVALDATVGVLDLDPEALDTLRPGGCEIFRRRCDVSDHAAAGQAVDEFCAEHGTVDVLVNNAGLIYNSPLISLTAGGVKRHDPDMWDKVLAANLSSAFHMTTHVAAHMFQARIRGVVINVSSICAAGNAGQCAYSAAKAGVNALTTALAKELGMLGIRVAAIAPGYTDTPSTHAGLSEENLKHVIRNVPVRRLGTADEIADGILWIIGNDFFNGKVLALDGGLVF